jgi:hypothetical protein
VCGGGAKSPTATASGGGGPVLGGGGGGGGSNGGGGGLIKFMKQRPHSQTRINGGGGGRVNITSKLESWTGSAEVFYLQYILTSSIFVLIS